MQSIFSEQVREVVRSIPKGSVMTYGAVAAVAGAAGAARAVGGIMRNNYDPTVPCHRVVAACGHIGQYNRGGEAEKRRLLELEGVKFTKTGKIQMEQPD
jgi:O-6-methylguanine DNA methyltransferase